MIPWSLERTSSDSLRTDSAAATEELGCKKIVSVELILCVGLVIQTAAPRRSPEASFFRVQALSCKDSAQSSKSGCTRPAIQRPTSRSARSFFLAAWLQHDG